MQFHLLYLNNISLCKITDTEQKKTIQIVCTHNVCCSYLLMLVVVGLAVAFPVAYTNKKTHHCNIFYSDVENMTVFNALKEHVEEHGKLYDISIPTSSIGGCSCPLDSQPVFIAPYDLCRSTQHFGPNTSSFCKEYGNLQQVNEHMLVCTNQTQIDYMWRNQSSCHEQETGLPFLNRGYLVCKTCTYETHDCYFECVSVIDSDGNNWYKQKAEEKCTAEVSCVAIYTSRFLENKKYGWGTCSLTAHNHAYETKQACNII